MKTDLQLCTEHRLELEKQIREAGLFEPFSVSYGFNMGWIAARANPTTTTQDDKAKVRELRETFNSGQVFASDIETLFEILERAGLSK